MDGYRTQWPRVLPLATAVVAALLAAGCGSDDDGDTSLAGLAPREACDRLANQAIGNASLGRTTLVAATATTPEHCQVRGRIDPQTNFEARLPSTWNGKVHFGGGGGFNGTIPAANANALAKGYAQVSTDSGHAGNPGNTPLNNAVFDASWALSDPVAVENFGFRSTPAVMTAMRDLVVRRYGQAPSRSYFEGCSNGGREALMNAQRFPDLFDGIISRAPAYNFTGLVGGAFNRNAKALAAPGGRFTPGKLDTLSRAVLAACDTAAADGVADGIVSNLQACRFDPAVLRCTGVDSDACLTDAQLAVLGSWTSDTAVAGVVSNRAWPLTGNESDPGAWPTWVTGNPTASPAVPSLQFTFQDQFVRYMLAKNPSVDSLAYAPETNAASVASIAAVIDATSTNLQPFAGSQGKLILWHGANDSAISVNGTTQYYQQVVSTAGGQQAADQFVRYYVAPGVNHCSGGPGADQADLLAALDAWVSSGTAPGDLAATKTNAQTGATVLSRPLCVYPRYPRYNGSGDPNAAASYTCTAP